MNATNDTIVTIDAECPAEFFWDALTEEAIVASPLGEEARKLARELRDADLDDMFEYPRAVVRDVVAWFQTLPDWDCGCEFAPNPIVVNPVEGPTAEVQIREAVVAYAIHHEVDLDLVTVERKYDGDGQIVAVRLSLDGDGRSHGCDETIEIN